MVIEIDIEISSMLEAVETAAFQQDLFYALPSCRVYNGKVQKNWRIFSVEKSTMSVYSDQH